MNKIVKLLKTVTLGGHDVEPGKTLELDEVSAKALINEGAAKLEDAELEGEVPTATEQKEEVAGAVGTEDPSEMQRKALDAQYKKEELAEAAKAIGIEFKYDAKKGEIIDAVIASGKAEMLIK